MADKQINQLVAASTMNDDDLLVMQQGGTAKKLSGKILGDYVYAAAADKVAEVNQAVADAQAAVSQLEADKDSIAQTVASMAQLGTDTALNTTGMAADAKAAGDAIGDLKESINILKQFHKDELSWAQIQQIVQSGNAQDWFNIGDQLEINWTKNGTVHKLPFDVVSFDPVLKYGESAEKPGLWLQSHYAGDGVQFSASNALYVATEALPAGTYHFTIGTNWGTHCVAGTSYQFTTTKQIPAGGQIMVGRNNEYYTWGAPDQAVSGWRVHTFESSAATTPLDSNLGLTEGTGGTDLGTTTSSIKYSTSGINNLQRAAYGYNRWSQSANRQYYNSDAAAGAWWTPQNPFDRAPQQLASLAGYMSGFDADFLAVLGKIKVTTALNTVSDSEIGTTEDTYDTFFLPSLEQEYIVPQLAGVEGAYWPYWKERLELDTPQIQGSNGTNANHIRYAYDARTSAQHCRLRSASRGVAGSTWRVGPSGSAYSFGSAAAASRGCPACVIC